MKVEFDSQADKIEAIWKEGKQCQPKTFMTGLQTLP
jgi:hypothetical protein